MSNHIGDTNKMVDTPRTEAEVNRQKCWSDDLVTIDANFACQLERELNAANQRIKRLEELGKELRECASWVGHSHCQHVDQIRRAKAAIEAWDKEAKL